MEKYFFDYLEFTVKLRVYTSNIFIVLLTISLNEFTLYNKAKFLFIQL